MYFFLNILKHKILRYKTPRNSLTIITAMKKVYITVGIVFLFILQNQLFAQKFDQIDENPTDIAYLRDNTISKPIVKVIYGRPHKNADKVFGEQIPYGKIWKTGDNEATEVRFYSDIQFGGKLIKAGTYILHSIPGEEEWTIILNSNTDTWGAYFYDPSKDIARIKVPAKKANELEVFSIGFQHTYKNTFMVLAWDTTRVSIPLITHEEILARI
jgi:hypothetical protein